MESSSRNGQSGNWSKHLYVVLVLSLFGIGAIIPTLLDDFFLPGTQPGQVSLESPGRCLNCHDDPGNANTPVSIGTEWQGSMMSQAMRDPLYLAGLAIANQDAAESGDLCIRCHSPEGWLESRSTPTDGSALTGSDIDGVHCDVCHSLVKPADIGENPYPNDAYYTSFTLQKDQDLLATLADIPPQSGNGMFVVSSDGAKRGPYSDASPKHQWYYSPFHKEAELCATCHDVSNPAFNRLPDDSYAPNSMGSPSNSFDTYEMFPIERTYSEWLMSDYNSEQGVYAPQFGGNKLNVSTCQDCHMKDVTGYGANKKGILLRNDLPLHDMTGGNTFVPELLKQMYPDDPMVNHAALDAGILRARDMLQKAASMELTAEQTLNGYDVNVKILNETGHKLPSGYPEGRRIWINLKAYDIDNSLIYESGKYDPNSAILTKDSDIKIYEVKPGLDATMAGITGLEEGPGFHFVLNNKVFFDNRIPPRGFTNAAFDQIQSPPVGVSYEDGQYWDNTVYTVPWNTSRIEATLFYQTTSKEFVEFLRDENVTNDAGQVMYDLWNSNGKSTPELMIQDQLDLPEFVCMVTSGLDSEVRSDTEVMLTWDAVEGADHYTVGVNVVGTWEWHNYSTSTNSILATGLKPGTYYRYRIKTYCDVTDIVSSYWTNFSNFVTSGIGCQFASNLQSSIQSETEVLISWDGVEGADHYTVGVNAIGTWQWQFYTTSTNSVLATGLEGGTNYRYRITTYCDATETKYSYLTKFSIFTTPGIGCQFATNPGSIIQSDTEVLINWDAVEGADHYTVGVNVVGTWEWHYYSTSTNSVLAIGLEAGTSYRYRIKTYCDVTEIESSYWTKFSNFVTSGTGCQFATNLQSIIQSETEVFIRWDFVEGADHYTVGVNEIGTWEWNYYTTSTSSVLANGLKEGTNYRFRITTYCDGAETESSYWTKYYYFSTEEFNNTSIRIETNVKPDFNISIVSEGVQIKAPDSNLDYDINIYSMNGKLIFSGILASKTTMDIDLDLGNFNRILIFTFSNGRNYYLKKVFIHR